MRRDDPHSALADELLGVRCLLGEAAAFDELVERWHEPLGRYVRRLVDGEDAAADALQDVWLRVLRAMPQLRDPRRLRAWLFGIARRAVLDRVRRRYAEPAPVALEDAELPAPEADADLAEAIALMREELARLPFAEREALVLFYLDELSLAQIAEVLAVPVGTVKSRLHRARGLLRRHVTAKGVEP